MITWDNFYLFAIVAVALWILGAGFALFSNVKSRMAVILSVLGTITLSVLIAGIWISLQRPPLRTMGYKPKALQSRHQRLVMNFRLQNIK